MKEWEDDLSAPEAVQCHTKSGLRGMDSRMHGLARRNGPIFSLMLLHLDFNDAFHYLVRSVLRSMLSRFGSSNYSIGRAGMGDHVSRSSVYSV